MLSFRFDFCCYDCIRLIDSIVIFSIQEVIRKRHGNSVEHNIMYDSVLATIVPELNHH